MLHLRVAVIIAVLLGATLFAVPLPAQSGPVIAGTWVAQGPGPLPAPGRVEGITPPLVSGRIDAVLAHPIDPDILWIGATGGVWKTTNATDANPDWTPLTDHVGWTSVYELLLDRADPTNETLMVLGEHRHQKSAISKDGGATWTDPFQTYYAVTAVIRDGVRVTGAEREGEVWIDPEEPLIWCARDRRGIYLNDARVLAGKAVPHIAEDPANEAILYAVISYDNIDCDGSATEGVYKSMDRGRRWIKVSNAAINSVLSDSVAEGRVAVGAGGALYVLTFRYNNAGYVFRKLFRSGDGGLSWTELDRPTTDENGTLFDLNVTGSQFRFELLADPIDPHVVYLAGNHQPLTGDGNAGTPNSIGASFSTGRLFRVDASEPAGSQATPLTHCAAPTTACNDQVSTFNNSAPPRRSSEMAFDANGDLIVAGEGGVYRRTNPRGAGDWFSMNGNLGLTGLRSIAYDSVSGTIVGGKAESGAVEQSVTGSSNWLIVGGGLDVTVAVDDRNSATRSIRYEVERPAGTLRRRIVDATGTTVSETPASLTVTGAGPAFPSGHFKEVVVNAINPARLLLVTDQGLWESFDRGDTVRYIGTLTGLVGAYGGTSAGVVNEELIWLISGGSSVYLRTSSGSAFVPAGTLPSDWYGAGDMAVHPNDWRYVYVVSRYGQRLGKTTNGGGSWSYGYPTPRHSYDAVMLSSILLIPLAGGRTAIVGGTSEGVYWTDADSPTLTWYQFGAGLPLGMVADLDYDAADDTLVAAMTYRGAWKVSPVVNHGPVPQLTINDVTVNEGNSGTSTATFTVTLNPPSTGTVTVRSETVGGTATSPGDYQYSYGTLTFAPGITQLTTSVTVVGDQIAEPRESFLVRLWEPSSNAVIADAQGIGTILDDDGGIWDVVATATAPTIVAITWTPTAASSSSYRVYRSNDRVNFQLVGSPVTPPFNDTTAAAGTAYLYKVRAFNGVESADSNVDLAGTFTFTDPALTAGFRFKPAHFTELLTAVNSVRMLAGLSSIAFSAPAPAPGVTLRAQHILALRNGLAAARAALALPVFAYTDPVVTVGRTTVKAVHITDVRNATK